MARVSTGLLSNQATTCFENILDDSSCSKYHTYLVSVVQSEKVKNYIGMKKILGSFLVGLALVCGCFCLSSCSGGKLIWCTSNGIITYNRHTGQFEMLWEHAIKQPEVIHDTIYIKSDEAIIED